MIPLSVHCIAEKLVMAQIYFNVLTKYVTPQLEEYQQSIIFSRMVHYLIVGLEVFQFLNKTFPD